MMAPITLSKTRAPAAQETFTAPKVDTKAIMKLLANGGVRSDKLNGVGVRLSYSEPRHLVFGCDALDGPGAPAVVAQIKRILARPDAQKLLQGLPLQVGVRSVAIAQEG
jgi:hypothetical protein